MKNAKKIGIALLIIAVISVGIAFAVMANGTNYTGDVAKLSELVERASKETTIQPKEEALTEVETYIAESPVDPASEGYADVMAAYQTAKIDMIGLYQAEIAKEGTELENALVYAETSDKWFASAFRNEEGEKDARLAATLATTHASNMKLVNTLYGAVDTDAMKGADNAAAVADAAYKRTKAFFNSRVFDDQAADYTAFKTKMDALITTYTESKEARYQALLAEARMADYDAKVSMDNTFETTSPTYPTMANYSGYQAGSGGTIALKNTYGQETETLPDGSINRYFAVHINGARNAADSGYVSTMFTLDFGGVVDRFVMEFDLTSFDKLPNLINFQSRPSQGTNQWFAVQGDGDIVDHNNKVIVAKAFVPGEWTHVSIVCEMENINQSRLYLDYAFVGYLMGDHKGYGYTPSNMRVGNSTNASGSWAVDNLFVGFQGSICDKDYLNKMNAAERFAFLTEYMQRTGSDEIFIKVPDCVVAYNKATELVQQFGILNSDGAVEYTQATEAIEDADLKAKVKKAVDDYYAYDPFDIILEYKTQNIIEYKTMLEALVGSSHAPVSSSISNRNSLIGKIDAFTDANGDYLLKAGDDFLPITKGNGLADDPYILTYGDHELNYTDSFGGGWAYYKYVAKEFGILSFSSPGDSAAIARGDSKDTVAQLTEQSIDMIVHPGDEVWFGIKSKDGAPASDAIKFSTTLARVSVAADTVQHVNYGDGTVENPYDIYHVNNTLTHSVSYAKNTAAKTYKYYIYEAKMDGTIDLSVTTAAFKIAYGDSIDNLGDEVQSAIIEVKTGDKIWIRVGNPSKIGSSAVTMNFTLTATRGLGTADNPYIVDRSANTLSYAGDGEWTYYKYTAKGDGIIALGAEGAVIGKGYNADGVTSVGSDYTEIIVSKDEVVWFGVKTADGSAADVAVSCVLYDLLDYDTLLNTYASSLDRIAQDSAILNFNTTMSIIENATSASLLQSKYQAASDMIADGLNTALLDEPGYQLFKHHYTVTYVDAPAKIDRAVMDANAKSLILTINYITERYPEEADWRLTFIENATTPEELANNETYNFVESYVSLIRERIDGGNYNAFYTLDDGTSVDMAISRFSAMNEYYYTILQGKHIEAINAQFDEFAKTSSFIEKQGIISYIQRYLNKESVDFYVELTCQNELCGSYGVLYSGKIEDVARPSCPICDMATDDYRLTSDRPELYTILKKYTAYEAELAPQAENYEEMLNQNTIYFVNAVKRFDTAITYVEKRALLNEAMPYYYSMNISSDDVKEAIVRYDALAEELEAIENASLEFAICVMTEMPAARDEYGEDGYYEKLISATLLYANVDASVEGVDQLADAIAQYNTELAAYKATIDTANDEIAEATTMIGALGANCGFTAIVSVVLKDLLSYAN